MTEEKLEKAKSLLQYKQYLQGTANALKGNPISFHELQIGYNQGGEAVQGRAQKVNAKIRDFMQQVLNKELAAVEEEFKNL